MFFFFALGATGGITSLLTSDKPIFERYIFPWFHNLFLRKKKQDSQRQTYKTINTWFSFSQCFSCSPHAVTGFIGLTLLTIQSILPTLFEVHLFTESSQEFCISISCFPCVYNKYVLWFLQGNASLRNIHGILGSGIMTLFLVHAALGLQLGLSY